MLTENDARIARELKKRLSEVTKLVDFKVFGSRARGDADEYSDMDVFVEVEELNRVTKEEIRHLAWEVGFENSIHISPLLFTRYELEDTPVRSSPIVVNIAEEGIRI